MSWKNFFYFDRRDKNAILLLLVLIVVSFFSYLLLYNQKGNSLIVENKYEFRIDSTEINKLGQGEVVDLNLADTVLLKGVPGIGSSYAARIIKYRESLGGYISIEQIKEVWGVDDIMYNKISPYFTISGKPKKLRVNYLEYKDMIKHPYLNKDQVKIILDLSKRKNNLTSLKRLSLLEEFSANDIKRLEPYLSFD